MFILMILDDFCLLPAQVCYIIAYIQKVESCVQIMDCHAPWKISNGAKNLVLQALKYEEAGVCHKFPGGGKHKSVLI
jgi:hypothetical protein